MCEAAKIECGAHESITCSGAERRGKERVTGVRFDGPSRGGRGGALPCGGVLGRTNNQDEGRKKGEEKKKDEQGSPSMRCASGWLVLFRGASTSAHVEAWPSLGWGKVHTYYVSSRYCTVQYQGVLL